MEIVIITLMNLALILCSLYDIKRRIIPNYLVIIILMIGCVNSINSHSLLFALAGMFLPSALLLLLRSRFHAIGAGDIKLLSATGSWLGWLLNIYVFCLSCFLALGYVFLRRYILKEKTVSIPFAPFITLSTMSLYVISCLLELIPYNYFIRYFYYISIFFSIHYFTF